MQCIAKQQWIKKKKKKSNADDAAFKLNAIDLAVKEGNRAAVRKLGINESTVYLFKS